MVNGPGQRDLDRAVGIGAQEFDVADFHRPAAADAGDDAGDEGRTVAAADDLAGLLEVDALQRGREMVGVAFAPDLAVGDDVDAGALHVADGEDGRVVLRQLQQFAGEAPHLRRAHARHLVVVQALRGRPASPAAGSCRRRWWAAASRVAVISVSEPSPPCRPDG